MKRQTEKVRSFPGAALLLLVALASTPALAETDRITVEDPATSVVKFKVTSDGNVTAASYTGDGAGLANVPHWKGTWNSASAYAKDDCVHYNGSSWIALQAGTNLAPAINPTHWGILAQQGLAGTGGTNGTNGTNGANGATGPQGPAGSPDTQSQILSKISTISDGAILAVQQGPTEATNTTKLAVKNTSGVQKFSVGADGTILVNTNTLDSAGSKLNVVNENNNSTLAFDSYANYYSYGGGGLFRFARGSHTTKTSVQNGDRLGYFIFSGYDGTNFVNSVGVTGKVDGPVSSGVVPAKITFETGSPRVERMVVTSAGNIGIGAITPAQKLEVNGGVRLNTATARPACDATSRGTLWVTQGTTDDLVEVCAMVGGTLVWKIL
jgi:hypothetical protein